MVISMDITILIYIRLSIVQNKNILEKLIRLVQIWTPFRVTNDLEGVTMSYDSFNDFLTVVFKLHISHFHHQNYHHMIDPNWNTIKALRGGKKRIINFRKFNDIILNKVIYTYLEWKCMKILLLYIYFKAFLHPYLSYYY